MSVISAFYQIQELDLLAPKSKVFKLVGPILLTVDLDEAKENVGKRLEFIEAEVHKVDASIGRSHNINKLKLWIHFFDGDYSVDRSTYSLPIFLFTCSCKAIGAQRCWR